jgi:glycosyltransferase involved in cell wall biosynthesis
VSTTKKLLLVCFSFPPFPGIGGRRWAKFAKYLAKEGFELHVVGAGNPKSDRSEWIGDVNSPNIKLHPVPLGYTSVLSFPPTSIIQKMIYKLLWNLSDRFIKGNSQDKIFFVRKRFVAKIEEVLKTETISALIVTIPPYKLSYYILPLKKKYPDVKFIVDYRDPWTDNRSYHGFSSISKERLIEEIKFENEVLNSYDAIMDVNTESLAILKQRLSQKDKLFHIPNGFDTEDYDLPFTVKEKKDDKIRFIYSGSFYPNLVYLLEPLINCLRQVKTLNPKTYSRIEFNFYGTIDHTAKEFLEKSGMEVMNYHGSVSKKEIIQRISESDYCLLFSAFDHGAAFNTKFYEYLCFRKPIIYLGPEGKLSSFISHNAIGYAFTPHSLETTGVKKLIEIINDPVTFNTELNINDFDICNITKKVIQVINV